MTTSLGGLLVLNPDVIVMPVAELPDDTKSQIDHDPGDYALSRPQARTGSKVIDADAASLVSRFTQPRTLTEAVILFARERELDPMTVLEGAHTLVRGLVEGGFLLRSDVTDTARTPTPHDPVYPVGTRLLGAAVLRTLAVLEDTELAVLDRDGSTSVLKTDSSECGDEPNRRRRRDGRAAEARSGLSRPPRGHHGTATAGHRKPQRPRVHRDGADSWRGRGHRGGRITRGRDRFRTSRSPDARASHRPRLRQPAPAGSPAWRCPSEERPRRVHRSGSSRGLRSRLEAVSERVASRCDRAWRDSLLLRAGARARINGASDPACIRAGRAVCRGGTPLVSRHRQLLPALQTGTRCDARRHRKRCIADVCRVRRGAVAGARSRTRTCVGERAWTALSLDGCAGRGARRNGHPTPGRQSREVSCEPLTTRRDHGSGVVGRNMVERHPDSRTRRVNHVRRRRHSHRNASRRPASRRRDRLGTERSRGRSAPRARAVATTDSTTPRFRSHRTWSGAPRRSMR